MAIPRLLLSNMINGAPMYYPNKPSQCLSAWTAVTGLRSARLMHTVLTDSHLSVRRCHNHTDGEHRHLTPASMRCFLLVTALGSDARSVRRASAARGPRLHQRWAFTPSPDPREQPPSHIVQIKAFQRFRKEKIVVLFKKSKEEAVFTFFFFFRLYTCFSWRSSFVFS